MRVLLSLGFALMTTGAQAQSSWIVTQDDVTQSVTDRFAVTLGSQFEDDFAVAAILNQRAVVRLNQEFETELQSTIHSETNRCGGYTIYESEAAALRELQNPFYDTAYLNRSGLFPVITDQHTSVLPALDMVNATSIVDTITWMQNQGTRYYQSTAGAETPQILKTQWEGYAPTRPDFSVTTVNHTWLQDSVIATITGTSKADEIIVIGGHLDSINAANTSQAPGADDNASGIAAVSEILRVMLDSGFKPQRTLKFIGYAAEEVGLRGSQNIAQEMDADPTINVIAALQFDMTGFSGSAQDMYFISDYVSTDLTNFMKLLISTYNGPGTHEITYGDTACGYACSDHASWTSVGVPSAFPFEARFADYNSQIHSSGDLLPVLDTTGAKQAKFAKLGVAFAMELAKEDDASPSPAPPVKNGFVWANNATAASYTPVPTYAHNSAGGPVTIQRLSTGRYLVRFSGLGGAGRPGANVIVTGYGNSRYQCKVRSWSSASLDMLVSVQCLNNSGAPVDDRYTVLVNWP